MVLRHGLSLTADVLLKRGATARMLCQADSSEVTITTRKLAHDEKAHVRGVQEGRAAMGGGWW